MIIGWIKGKPRSLGIVAGILCYLAMDFRIKRKID